MTTMPLQREEKKMKRGQRDARDGRKVRRRG